MRKNKQRVLIKELVKRREEVIKRAILIANKDIPEHLIECQLSEIIEWMVEPHIREKFGEYNKPSDKEVRGFQRLLQKVVNKVKGEKNG